jgi:hypothetical protein
VSISRTGGYKRGVNRSYVESLLVGVPLPASKSELIAYAARQHGGAEVAAQLERVPDREYSALQDVGEELEPRQIPDDRTPPPLPSEEADVVPGGPAYTGGSVEPSNVLAAHGEDS